ncbi:hypothetical protein [Caldibacillus thermoamylovorans]|uniref:hypothetical protein n=1 Tax=Caldibacillus thermoamylovorans TaxID=35841 RepID=UPI00203B0761|nr:hypothetical protein [Caldibacillus thermoamylovorans]MCM3476768.1 hypothetical protein [Caldibacillus thermoamylovorans]
MTTRANLVTILMRKMIYFGDEGGSRHRFQLKNAQFWRRELISSPFLVEKRPNLATRAVLVTVFSSEMLNLGDESCSRHHF